MAFEAFGLHPDLHGFFGRADADEAVLCTGFAAHGIKAGSIRALLGIEHVQLRTPDHGSLQKLPVHLHQFQTKLSPLLIDQRQNLLCFRIKIRTGDLQSALFPIGTVSLIFQILREVQCQ